MLRVEFDGVSSVQKLFGKLKKNANRTMRDVLDQTGQMILKRALQYVPVDTGALRASGRSEVSGRGNAAKVDVSFGRTAGGFLGYAVYVHENPLVYHKPPTCYKYLSRAVRETKGARAALVKRVLGMMIGGA